MKKKLIIFLCLISSAHILNAIVQNIPTIPEAPAEIPLQKSDIKIDYDIIENQIRQLIRGNSIPPIIKILQDNRQISEDELKKIVQDIINDPGSEYFETVLLFALASSIKPLQTFFFGLIEEPRTKKNEPVVWAAAEIDESLAAIPDFVKYVASTPGKEKFARVVEDAVSRTIDEDDAETLNDLMPFIKISPADADAFLWHVVKENKDGKLIPLLQKLGAHIDTVADIIDNGKTRKQTPLMYVVDHVTDANRPNLIHALLDAGAEPDFSPAHNDITARSIARDKGISGVQKAFDVKSLGKSVLEETHEGK